MLENLFQNIAAFATPKSLLALITLTGMEIVLGIDNIIFLTILVGKLPKSQQDVTRRRGLALALITRLGLLSTIYWFMRMTVPLFTVFGHGFTGKDLILILGGLFLVAKATFEIHDKIESHEEERRVQQTPSLFGPVLIQIALLDIVFSLDSVITAVGMADQLPIMVTAMLIAVGVMLFAAKGIGEFVERHPTVKILALAFLLLIGITLMIEGMGGHVNKGYIYFAMFFSLAVEMLNMRYLKKNGRKRG